MDCIILAGGIGSRLKTVISHLPKPLAPINNIPFIHILINQLISFTQIKKIVLAVGYKSQQIINYCENSSFSLPIEFSIEQNILGTGGAIINALKKTTSSDLLILNGDSYFDIDFSSFFSFHSSCNADVTIACLEKEDSTRYGKIIFEKRTGKILSFNEKSADMRKGWINGGIYLFKRSSLMNLPFTSPFSLEKEVFPYLLKKNIFGYPTKGLFIDIGTPISYKNAQKILKTLTQKYYD